MTQAAIHSPSTHQNLMLGLVLGVAAYVVVPMGDGIAKILTTMGYHSGQVTFGRYFFHMLFLMPIVLIKFGPSGFIPKNLKVQTFRALTIVIATFCFFSSLHTVPLADALSLAFVAPLVVTALSVPILGEKVGIHRWVAVIIGFAGAMIIIQPGSGVFQWPALYALSAGALFGVYITVTRKTAGDNPAFVSLLYQGVLGTAALSILAFMNWSELTLEAVLLMAGVGAAAATGHGLIIAATKYMEAALLAPLQYQELIVGAVFGYLVFGEIPADSTWLGSGVIILSGLYIGYRERKTRSS
ncbi:DMT family transporter [Curvivirga sp.]|uniref:DMT family transporter n=1 Tax=Curvivirga sp. TaxID=2856848 RepID=UPI003B5B5E35